MDQGGMPFFMRVADGMLSHRIGRLRQWVLLPGGNHVRAVEWRDRVPDDRRNDRRRLVRRVRAAVLHAYQRSALLQRTLPMLLGLLPLGHRSVHLLRLHRRVHRPRLRLRQRRDLHLPAAARRPRMQQLASNVPVVVPSIAKRG